LGFTLTVTDNGGATGTDEIGVTVRPRPNTPPGANAGADQTVTSGATVTLTGSGSDPDGTIAAYQWAQIAGPAVTLTGANTASASFTAPVVTANTILGFTLTVTDNRGATASSAIAVTVVANQAPTANAGAAQTVNEGTAVTLYGTASSDPDGTIVSYQWTQLSGPTATLTAASTATATVTAPYVTADSVLRFELRVTDDKGAAATATTDVTVRNVANTAPTANAAGPYGGKVGSAITFNGAASSDPEGKPLTYRWDFGDGASGTGVNPTHAYAAAGTYTVTLVVNDGEYDSAPASATAIVIPQLLGNVSAAILPDNVTVSAHATQLMALAVTNLTGQTVSRITVEYGYSAGLTVANLTPTGSPSTATVDTTARAIRLVWNNVANNAVVGAGFTLSSASAGTYSLTPGRVEFELADGSVNPIAGANTVTVNVVAAANQPPTVNAGADQIVNEATSVQLAGFASDTDGTVIGYLWTQTAGPTVLLSNPLSAAPTFVAPQVTADTLLTFRLTVSDNALATASDTVNITVRDTPNQPPVANAGPDQRVKQKTAVTLNGTGSSDPDGAIAAYSWRKVLGPSVTLNGANSATPAFTAPSTRFGTLLIFELTVTDNAGASATDTITVVVKP
jgi:PKD repeat protein